MAEFDELPALARTIEPLPGGLAELRRRIREPRRSRAPFAVALAAACSAAIAMCVSRRPQAPEASQDRTAMRRLLVDGAQLPNPRAVELGLVERARPVVTGDPRVAPNDAVVFYWVPPAPADHQR